LELLLFAVQSPINIGMALRVAEAYGFYVSIFDRHGVLDDREKLKTAEDFACGSFSRRGLERLSDLAAVARHRQGRRLIVTSVLPGACSLPHLQFQPRDIVVLGNEYDRLT
jgi:tRNA(Leu) C34 or U34 (ribose-2'-O)-methylase TrmL